MKRRRASAVIGFEDSDSWLVAYEYQQGGEAACAPSGAIRAENQGRSSRTCRRGGRRAERGVGLNVGMKGGARTGGNETAVVRGVHRVCRSTAIMSSSSHQVHY